MGRSFLKVSARFYIFSNTNSNVAILYLEPFGRFENIELIRFISNLGVRS